MKVGHYMKTKAKILIVDDNRIIRAATRSFEHDAARGTPAFEICAGQRVAQAVEKRTNIARMDALESLLAIGAVHEELDDLGVSEEGAAVGVVGRQEHLPGAVDQQQQLQPVGQREPRRIVVVPVVAGHQRHAGLFHQLLGLGLQAHGLDLPGKAGGIFGFNHQHVAANLRNYIAGFSSNMREVLEKFDFDNTISKLDEEEAGRTYRLPNEVEWEYARR